MKLRRTGWGLAVVALSACVCSAAQYTGPKVPLKLKFPSGSYVMTTTMGGEQSVTVDDQAQPAQQMSQTFVVAMDTSEPDKEGLRTMKMAYKQVKQTLTVGAQVVSYDSQGPADKQDPNLARAMGPLTKAKITVKIGADDKIISVAGLNDLWDAMAKETPDMAPFAAQMKTQMGDNAIRDMITKQAEMFPDKPIGPGDEWQPNMKFSLPMTGEIDIKQHAKLLDIEQTPAGKVAAIQYDGTAQSTKEATSNLGGVNVTIRSLSFKQTGQTRFNIDAGIVDGVAMNHEGSMEMQVPGQEGKTQKVVTKQKMKMDVKLTKGGAEEGAPITSTSGAK